MRIMAVFEAETSKHVQSENMSEFYCLDQHCWHDRNDVLEMSYNSAIKEVLSFFIYLFLVINKQNLELYLGELIGWHIATGK